MNRLVLQNGKIMYDKVNTDRLASLTSQLLHCNSDNDNFSSTVVSSGLYHFLVLEKFKVTAQQWSQ